MGLDVYLYHYDGDTNIKNEHALLNEHVKHIDNLIKPIWQSDCDREVAIKKSKIVASRYFEKHNLPLKVNEFGPSIQETAINHDSSLYPNHIFKIGYFRSSYNSNGFNNYMLNTCDYDLGKIFEPTEYLTLPNWKKAKIRASHAVKQIQFADGFDIMSLSSSVLDILFNIQPDMSYYDQLKKYRSAKPSEDMILFEDPLVVYAVTNNCIICKKGNNYEVFDIPFSFIEYEEKQKALKKFFNHQKRKKFDRYRDIDGHFFFDGLKVFAIIRNEPLFSFIIKTDKQFYAQASEIILETINWVLDKNDPENYYFYWSG